MKALGLTLVCVLMSGSILVPVEFLPALALLSSSTIITSSLNPSTFSQGVTFTATITPSTAIGTVQFIDASTSPATILGTARINTGVAIFTITTLSTGSHNIVANYLGDSNTASSSSIELVQVVNHAPLTATSVNISDTEGNSFQGKVAHFTDADLNTVASDYTGTINWGDGTTSSATITSTSGGFDLSGTHAYAEEGSYLLHITIVDNDGTTATTTSSATVSDASLTTNSVNISTVVDLSFQGILAHFIDADSNGVASDYAGTINWGDGTTSSGTIVTNSGGGFDLIGTHTYSSIGTKSTSITVHDSGGSSATVTGTATTSQTGLPTTIVLSSNATSIIAGHNIRFTASITPNTATGTVQLLVNGTNFASNTLSSGTVTFTTSSLHLGNNVAMASYLGSTTFKPSTSNSIIIKVSALGSGNAQSTGNSLSSDATFGQLTSDFVHQRNALKKELRNETITMIHECRAQEKSALPGDKEQIKAECKVKLQQTKQNFKTLLSQLRQEFDKLKNQFQSQTIQSNQQGDDDEKNTSENSAHNAQLQGKNNDDSDSHQLNETNHEDKSENTGHGSHQGKGNHHDD